MSPPSSIILPVGSRLDFQELRQLDNATQQMVVSRVAFGGITQKETLLSLQGLCRRFVIPALSILPPIVIAIVLKKGHPMADGHTHRYAVFGLLLF